MLSKFLRKITIGLLAFGIIFTNIQINTYAADLSDETYRISSLTEGELNVLVVRLGYKDYPLDETNDYYTAFSDKIIHKLFEGDEEGFSTPYNGLSDYLKKSSYNRMSVKVGNIVDIEMDSNYKDYLTEGGQPYWDVLSSEEFIKKFNDSVTVSDYDKNNDGVIDALYFFDMAGDLPLGYFEDAAALVTVNEDTSQSIHSFVFLRLADNGLGYGTKEWILQSGDINYDLNVIIHETGHLLLGLRDYYRFSDYKMDTNDIGDIMGNADPGSDFDALSKLSTGWLTNDNVIVTEPDDGETGVIELTPYDSDTESGVKIALFKCGLHNIAVDYCGGLNNNSAQSGMRNKGFRVYYTDNYLNPYKVLIKDTQDGTHQLFIENEDLEDIFGRGLTITDIQTGDNPSFRYTYTDKESNYKPIDYQPLDDIGDPIYEINVNYKVSVLDEDWNDITNDIEIDFQDISESERSFDDIRYVEEKKDTLELYFFNFISQVDTKVSLSSVPDGYKESEVVLNLVRSDYGSTTIMSPNSNVEVIESENSNVVEIKVRLQKEQQEETVSKSDDTTESSDDNTQSSEEVTESSDDEKTDEQITSSEEITNNDNDNAQNKSSNKNEARKTTETVNKTASGKGTEAAVAKSNDSSAKIENNSATSVNQAPGTGDKNTTPLWISVACAAAGVIGTAIAVRRKKKAD